MKNELALGEQKQRFFWEKLVPALVCLCSCIFFLLFSILSNENNSVFFWGMVNDNELHVHGIKLTAPFRGLVLLLAAVCIFPYCRWVRKKPELCYGESWVKLGLVFGIAMLFMGFAAPPASCSVDPAWFIQMEGADSQDALDLFSQILEEHPLISVPHQVRLLLTSAYSLLFPLLLCMIVQIAQWRRKRKDVRTLIAMLLFVFSLTGFGDFSGLEFREDTVYYAVIGTTLFCGDCFFPASEGEGPIPAVKGDWKALLLHGFVLLALYGCSVAMFILEPMGMYERGGMFSEQESAISWILCLWLAVVLLAVKNRSFTATVLPLYLLVWAGVVCTFVVHFDLNPENIRLHITPFYPGGYYEEHPDGLFDASFALTCAASAIYAIFFLYDHGLKRHPWVIAGVTAVLIVSMYIPEYAFIPETCVTLCAMRNLFLAAIAPILVIAVGVSSGLTEE